MGTEGLIPGSNQIENRIKMSSFKIEPLLVGAALVNSDAGGE